MGFCERPPVWDIRGHMVLGDRSGSVEGFDFRVRCNHRRECRAEIDGMIVPIPADMTAYDYFDLVFSAAFRAPPDEAIAN